ncbi:MAG: O-antigen ligase family protein, partial [Anaerolineae bacterium]|nr:O-antigen ligase family protein [Anaerolineae bacterium]
HQTLNTLKWVTAVFLGLGILALIGRYGGPVNALVNPWLKPYAVSNGSFFVWMTALAAGQALFNQGLKRSWRIALFALAAAVPILGFWQNTDWASSWLPPLLALIIVLWLRSRFVSISFFFALILILALFSGVILGSYDWQAEREISVGGRFILWESVLGLSAQHPVLGLGLTTYRQYFQFIPLLTEAGRWWRPNVNSHNLYIDLFAQMGIVGLAVFGWAVFEIGRLGWRLQQRCSGDFAAGYVASALAGLIAMLVASAIVEWLLPFVYNVGFPGMRFSVMSWLFLGGLASLDRILPDPVPDQTVS